MLVVVKCWELMRTFVTGSAETDIFLGAGWTPSWDLEVGMSSRPYYQLCCQGVTAREEALGYISWLALLE